MSGRREMWSQTSEISHNFKAATKRMFRLAKEAGFPIEVIEAETKIPDSTLRGWASGNVVMPGDAMVAIAAIPDFPNRLISLLWVSANKEVIDKEPREAALHDVLIEAAKLVLRGLEAQHPDSPGQERIVHSETPDLEQQAHELADKLRLVA